jgi:hypothetical protein
MASIGTFIFHTPPNLTSTLHSWRASTCPSKSWAPPFSFFPNPATTILSLPRGGGEASVVVRRLQAPPPSSPPPCAAPSELLPVVRRPQAAGQSKLHLREWQRGHRSRAVRAARSGGLSSSRNGRAAGGEYDRPREGRRACASTPSTSRACTTSSWLVAAAADVLLVLTLAEMASVCRDLSRAVERLSACCTDPLLRRFGTSSRPSTRAAVDRHLPDLCLCEAGVVRARHWRPSHTAGTPPHYLP